MNKTTQDLSVVIQSIDHIKTFQYIVVTTNPHFPNSIKMYFPVLQDFDGSQQGNMHVIMAISVASESIKGYFSLYINYRQRTCLRKYSHSCFIKSKTKNIKDACKLHIE